MSIHLSTPYLEKDASRAPNFFNGRLLSAEDMTAEGTALRRNLALLGRATGEGIAHGLEVSGSIGGSTITDPVVTVSAGLAINRVGETIVLHQTVDVSLLQPSSSAASRVPKPANGQGGFGNCTLLATSDYAAGKGVYLLTVAPARGREGRAPVSGLGNLTACCSDNSIVDGVQFRLVRLTLSADDLNDNRLRNRLAHRCFGTTEAGLSKFAANPFGVPSHSYGLIDQLRDSQMTDAEVPLALVFWTDTGGIRFVDQWAVRRRLVSLGTPDRWRRAIGERPAAEGEAMFQQFQAHIEGWTDPSPEVVKAVDHFDHLPPAGVLPLGGTPARSGFIDSQFFATLTVRKKILVIEGSRLAALLRKLFAFPPIDLKAGELIWTYGVRENQQAAADALTVAPYLVFTTGHMPNFADPHFDVSKWSYANYYLNFGGTL